MLYYTSSDQVCTEMWYTDNEICASVFYTEHWESFNILHIWDPQSLLVDKDLWRFFFSSWSVVIVNLSSRAPALDDKYDILVEWSLAEEKTSCESKFCPRATYKP